MAAMASLDRDELLGLLRAAKEHSERDWMLLLVTFSHGLRASEAINLTKGNVKDGILTVKRLKGSMKTSQPLVSNSDPLLDEASALPAYMATVTGKKLFDITRFGLIYLMQRHGTTAGIPAIKQHPHVLKHTCAMLTIQRAGIENVRQYLGHVSIASTGSYLKVTDAAASSAIGNAMQV